MTERTVRKAVFPVAGIGSRFLPATKASPKEMMPVVDKPLIQYAVEEAAASGITDMIFITGRNKRAIEDHFDKAYELEAMLESQRKERLLDTVRGVLPAGCRCVYIRQAEPLGLGHAISCAAPVVGNVPFAVLLADELLVGNPPATAQLVERFSQTGVSTVGVQEVSPDEVREYGIVAMTDPSHAAGAVRTIIEKPDPALAPSRLAVVGRYVFAPSIFRHLAALRPGANGELQLTDAIALEARSTAVEAVRLDSRRFDCGSKLGYLMAGMALGLERPEIGPDLRRQMMALLAA